MGYDGSLKFNTEINEAGFNAAIGKLGGLAKGGLAVVGAAVAGITAAFTGVSKAALDSVASMEQNIGGVETLFKDSAKTVIADAQNAYKTAGMSANAYMQNVTSFSASLLQGLGGDTAKAAEIANTAMVDMSDNANKMGTDITSIQNAYQGFAKQNYTMLDNLKLGYGGTQSEMIRLINDSGILNEKIENLDNISFDQIIQAIHKIQENMGITGTTAKEAGTTIEGSVASAKAAFDNFLNGSGSPKELADSVSVAATNIVNNLMEIVPRLADELPKVGAMLMDSLRDSMGSGKLSELIAIGGEIVSNLALGIVQAIPGITNGATKILSTITQNLSAGIPTLLSSGRNILQSFLDGMMQLLPSVGLFITTLTTSLYEQISATAPGLLQKGYELLNNLVNGFVAAIPEALPKILNFTQGIGEKLAEAAPVMIQKGFELLGKLVEGITTAIPILIARVPEIVSTFANVINDNFPTILAKGAGLLWELIKGILSAIPDLIANIPQIITAIVDVIQAFNWLSLGKHIITLFKNGIMGMAGAVKNAGTSIYNSVKNAIQNLPTTLKNIGRSAASGLGNAIRSGIALARTAASSIGSAIVSAISSIPSKVISIGKNIVQGLWNGISGMVGWITDKVMGFANSVLGGIKKALGIKSPSRRMRDEVGKYMAIGMGIGFEKNIPIEDMNSEVTYAVKSMQKNVGTITKSPVRTTSQSIGYASKNMDTGSVGIDYERLGREAAKAMQGVGIYLDTEKVGKVITPQVSHNMTIDTRRKR